MELEKKAKKTCIHHWLLGNVARKGYFLGRCKKCGALKMFVDAGQRDHQGYLRDRRLVIQEIILVKQAQRGTESQG